MLHIHNKQLQKEDGYTIIEALVAMAIFSAMVMFSVTALNQGLRQYKIVMDEGLQFWDYSKNLWLLKSIGSTFDYYVGSATEKSFPYFYCDLDMMTYATTSALASEVPVIAWLVREKSEEYDGRYSLVYYEVPIYVKDLDAIRKLNENEAYKKNMRVVIFDDIRNVEFEVYVMNLQNAEKTWKDIYDSQAGRVLPEIVSIRVKSREGTKTMAFTIHNNSRIKEPEVE